MAHYDTFRAQLAIAHPAFGHALWKPDPGQYPPVQIGDVGFIRQGKFHRLFNALLPANHPSHDSRGTPEYHEPLRLRLQDHIDPGILSPSNFYSYGVNMVSGGLDALASGTGSAKVEFSCTRKQGAVLSLPVTARREDTISLGHFRKWIIKHIDSWLAFANELGVGIEMEDIVLVTGCHRTKSWTNAVLNEVQTNVQLSFGVQVGASGASVQWQGSDLRIQGAAISHGPNGEVCATHCRGQRILKFSTCPKNQCIFIRGFRVKRYFGLAPRIKAAAEPKPDTRGNDGEPEKEADPIPRVTKVRLLFFDFLLFIVRLKYRDPLHELLEYIAKVSSVDAISSIRDHVGSNVDDTAGTKLRYGPRSR
ncbi:hypothetical protein EDB85DRAFT_2089383 [Lactarius pseudohatsudake]|nr:hypothetical protein EDB85DRAFT_2089383 [Lactarius pseudohatsudake]